MTTAAVGIDVRVQAVIAAPEAVARSEKLAAE